MLQFSIIRRIPVILTKCITLFVFLSGFLLPVSILAQGEPEYDEISVFIEIPRVGGGEIAAVISGDELYLPVTDLFDFLKIRNIPSAGLDSISGFFIKNSANYVINRSENSISYQDKIFELTPGDLIRTESNLYLLSSYFGKVFGLECSFSFRSLSVTVNSKLELPIIREMRQAEMRHNLTRLKGDVIADTNIARNYHLFKFGMADWSVNSSEEINGNTSARLNLALGSMIAGGEFTAGINYNTTDPFTERQQQYLWRYVNNDFKPLRQVVAGKIAINAISSIYNPVIGVKFTNTPTTYRRSFGSYILSDYTEPGWIVELYVNNVLVDYVTADASGFFTFEVPLVYGHTIVNLKFIGPWGEEKTKEQNINIPFNFLPVKTFEYTLSAGIVEDALKSRFSRASFNYGITRSLTMGGGIEYLSSLTDFPSMPFLNASLKITNNLLFTGEFTYNVRAKSTLTYRLPSNMQFDINYTWYDKDQKAISYNFREERKATMATPMRIGKFSTYQRLSLYQVVMPHSKYTTGEWLFSGSILGVNTNLTSYALFTENSKPYIYSNLSMTFRLPSGFIIMPQTQYGYTKNEFLSAKVGVEKRLGEHAFMSLSYEQNFSNNIKMAELGFRYDFSFAQTGFSVRQSEKNTTLLQYARGSLINDRKTKYLGADNRSNVGKGGISIIPFIDLNSNGKKDQGEPKVYGLSLHTSGGRVEINEQDTTIRILGLEPYSNCYIELDPDSFENIAWRLPVQTMNVAVDPNILKLIEIPIAVAGEANGYISLQKNGELQGLGRVIVSFYTDNLKPAGKILTEDDGYFSYFGFAPGNYLARVDTAQLRKLGMKAAPEIREFEIKGVGLDGDIADGLDFVLKLKSYDTSITNSPITVVTEPVVSAKEVPVIRKDTTYMIIHEATQELVTIMEDSYAIQLGAFKKESNAENFRNHLEELLGKDIEIIIENGFYKVRITGLKDREEVTRNLLILEKSGVTEVWLTSLKAKQQLWILKDKQDSVATIKETIQEETGTVLKPDISIQVGAFRQKEKAMAMKDKLEAAIDKEVVIISEDNYYKVRVTGFSDRLEMENYLPELRKLGLLDLWVLPEKKPKEPVPAITQPIVEVFDSTKKVIEENELVAFIKETPLAPEPKISLQVGRFYYKYKAIWAKRRINTKLNLAVEIIKQGDYYFVIVTGFYKREDTYKYYPELAGLGYPVISLIEKK